MYLIILQFNKVFTMFNNIAISVIKFYIIGTKLFSKNSLLKYKIFDLFNMSYWSVQCTVRTVGNLRSWPSVSAAYCSSTKWRTPPAASLWSCIPLRTVCPHSLASLLLICLLLSVSLWTSGIELVFVEMNFLWVLYLLFVD